MWANLNNIIFTVFAVIFATLISPVNAQSDAEYAKAFAGKWISYSPSFAVDGGCILDLKSKRTNGSFPIILSNCGGELGAVSGWVITNGQLTLVTNDNKPLALLGGNQFRLSGESQGSNIPFVIEKIDRAVLIQKARKSINCSYVGYSRKCATPQQFSPPVFAGKAPSPVTILVNLNARIEPRPTANILGVLKPKSCIKAKVCTVASDGLWCQAEFGGKTAWFKKQAIRRGKWPIITFISGC